MPKPLTVPATLNTPARLAAETVFRSLDELMDSDWEGDVRGVKFALSQLAVGLLDAAGMLPGYEAGRPVPAEENRMRQVAGGTKGSKTLNSVQSPGERSKRASKAAKAMNDRLTSDEKKARSMKALAGRWGEKSATKNRKPIDVPAT